MKINDDIEYYIFDDCFFIYKVYKNKAKGEYRDNKGNWSSRTYVEQLSTIQYLKMRRIDKELANKFCREWHKCNPYKKRFK